MATIFDRVVLAKIEVTKGTDPTPAAATNAVRVRSVKITKNQTNIDRAVVKQTMGNLQHLIGKQTVAAEIVVEMRGSGTAGTAPEWSPLMQSCRTVETIVAGTSVTYKPSTATEKSCTIYVYQDGLLWKLLGAVGNVKIDAAIDGVITATFSMQAIYTAPTATAVATGAVYQSAQPLVMNSADVINDGAAIKVGAFSLDAGNDVFNHYTTGENSFVVQNRKPVMTFTKDSVNTAAEWTALAAGTTASLSAAFGATAGNIATITAPVGKRSGVAYNQNGERDTLDVSYNLFESTSDDQFSIALT